MQVLLRIQHGVIPPGRRTAMAVWLSFVVLTVRPAEAEFPLVSGRGSVAARVAGPCADSHSRPYGLLKTIADVALRPEGVLEGRVLRDEKGPPGNAVAGLPVALLRGGQTVARTRTDLYGRFALPSVSGGLYRVVVETEEGSIWRFYRVWTSSGAPPHAQSEVKVLIGRRLLRGQSPLPIRGLSGPAVMTAIAAGAIAPPIVYYNVKRDAYIPASP